MEILIVVSLLVLLAIALLYLLDPFTQIKKSQDSKRKTELSSLNKVLEDWYNDKNCYPKVEEICYDTADSNNSCHICGTESSSPTFSPYLSRLPCDPIHPTKKYLYQTDGSSCPGWYIVYTLLANNKDSAISEVGCQNGCGPTGNVNYNYFISSANVILEGGIGPTSSVPLPTSTISPLTPTATIAPSATTTPNPLTPTITPSPTPTIHYVGNCSAYSLLYINPNCNVCGNYVTCKTTHPGSIYYTDAGVCLAPCFQD